LTLNLCQSLLRQAQFVAEVPLELEAFGSCFVVFRRETVKSNRLPLVEIGRQNFPALQAAQAQNS
jgi:hypothetical protein